MKAPDDDELQLIVPESARAERADKLLARIHPELSRSRWQKLFQDGRVWVDERMLSQKDKLHAGETVQVALPPPVPLEMRPVEMPLSVLFEDEAILVLDKEPGRVVHPGAGTGEDTLVHGILHHCRGTLSGIGGTERPGIVHRLDKETSGVLVVAKTDNAHQSLSAQFAERKVRKVYSALIRGLPDPSSGVVDSPLGRHPVHRTRMACRPDGRHALTEYRLETAFGEAAGHVRLRIHTGRTHQIRVHMQHIGHPLLGDSLYGYKEGAIVAAGMPIKVPRVMLHASELEIRHPVSGKQLCFGAPLPADFISTMSELRSAFPESESH